MSSRIVLSASCKGAFRVEVLGARPDDVTRVMLTGQGDEHELKLAEGSYSVNVTDIGAGHRQNFDFHVGSEDGVVRVGGGDHRGANWRSVSERDIGRAAWKPTGGENASGQFGAFSPPKLISQTASGGRAFRGTVMVKDDWPAALKIVRSGSWSNNPLLRAEFTQRDGTSVRCFVPLYSGGTLVQRHEENGQVIDIKPYEPKSAAIVGSLTSSVDEELRQILQWAAGSDESEAVQSIMSSRDDPWIAAATGLLLVRAARLKPNGSSLSRLAARSPWLADLCVLAAWGRAADAPDQESACLDLLIEARRNGTVYFWQTCTIADRLLAALASSRSSAVRIASRKEQGLWKRLRADGFKIGALLGHATSRAPGAKR